MITLLKTHLNEIHRHGVEAYDEECCGAMLGSVNPNGEKQIIKLVRIENNSSEHRHRRFEVTPKDYQELEKKAKDEELTLLGFYHTHPNCPAQASETDLAYAWPFFSYIILSVCDRVPKEINSFVLNLDIEKFEPEEIKII